MAILRHIVNLHFLLLQPDAIVGPDASKATGPTIKGEIQFRSNRRSLAGLDQAGQVARNASTSMVGGTSTASIA